MSISLRRAIIDDLSTLQQLNNEVFIDNEKYDDDLVMGWATSELGKNYFSRILKNERVFCCIAEDGGKAVGYIACVPKEMSYKKSKYLEVENMGVIPEYRSKGIGAMLMENAKKWAKENGYQKLFVNSYFKNQKAIDFYKRNGFEEIDISLEVKI
ncbi:hypothetical protein A3G67_00020 [Candidatus Roizmanbacteria bacterium RIFCSPLOWO2_12_FULL_40_12]|nr:MAG: hypothetical protein A2W49_04390 [Candidatus Roizmanbacteria bacterium RIFCSPHIGHO2_12_41_18]OGK60461.1 MAG: hypothetical protein A3G67_00020 [Candidatus Roizmanbacteria bacterium RIFCSPLOWO2_12_FULL_40_12]